MFITSIVTFIGCTLFAAPYGRYSKDGWGVMLPAQLAWFLMESPNLWTSYIVISNAPASALMSTPNKLLLCCFLLHYINRSIVYPLRMGQATPMPLSVMLAAFSFCAWNGTHQVLQLVFVRHYEEEWIRHPLFIAGVALFAFGMYTNIQCDMHLVRMKDTLRQSMHASAKESDYAIGNGSSKKPKRYGIPRGGMFEFVSCANFFGEIVEWWGFAMASGFSLPAVAFAVYTMAYLTSRSLHYHKWYREKFEDYPPQRRAVLPFLL